MGSDAGPACPSALCQIVLYLFCKTGLGSDKSGLAVGVRSGVR